MASRVANLQSSSFRFGIGNASNLFRALAFFSSHQAGPVLPFRPKGVCPSFPDTFASGAVATDRFNRTTFHRFFRELLLLGTFGLLVDEGISTIVIPFEAGWCCLSAQIAVNALVIDVVSSRNIFWVAIGSIGHGQVSPLGWIRFI
jgi:hypothetical protein